MSDWFQIRYLYPARAHLHEEFRDSTPVSSQGISVDDQFQIWFLYLARPYLWVFDCRFDTCIQPGHVCMKSLEIQFLYPARATISSTNLFKFQFNTCSKPGNYLHHHLGHLNVKSVQKPDAVLHGLIIRKSYTDLLKTGRPQYLNVKIGFSRPNRRWPGLTFPILQGTFD